MPIAFGTDAGVIPHGSNAHEFQLLVEWGGMRNMDAIVAATSSAAKLLGWEKNIGSLTSGKWADIIAVSGDPLTDIRATEKGRFRDEERRDLQTAVSQYRKGFRKGAKTQKGKVNFEVRILALILVPLRLCAFAGNASLFNFIPDQRVLRLYAATAIRR